MNVWIPVNDASMPAYLAKPVVVANAPAVILLGDSFGLDAEMRTLADLVSQTGYVALAIDFARTTVTRQAIESEVCAAVDWLNAQEFVRFNHIVTWGLSLGGSAAFASSMLRGISGAIVFYGGEIAKPLPGGGPALIDESDRVRAPLLLFYGGADASIPVTEVERIENALRAGHKRFTLHVYAEQRHGFFRRSLEELSIKGYGTGFNDGAVFAETWHRVQDFLRVQLA